MFEELFHDQEQLQPTTHAKILLAKYRSLDWDVLSKWLSEIRSAVDSYDEDFLKQSLCALVSKNRLKFNKPGMSVSQAGGVHLIKH